MDDDMPSIIVRKEFSSFEENDNQVLDRREAESKIVERLLTHQDRGRLNFWALASSAGINTEPSKEEVKNITIPVTYFKTIIEDAGFEETTMRVAFTDDEDERGINLVDKISMVYPR
ncbi:hypothetical protein B0O99DRAFT_686371 [Bisporella sp. PMI_857]|nr:hypothetical protein B0O99DRAFT_686371 [Bisporella sp. PMI_857]